MPKNFQTSQYDEPLCGEGYLDIEVDGQPYRIGIERVHLEEDTGKNTHVGGATGRIHGADYSLVDYNRAGIPLVEIVTKPVPGTDALAPEVARVYVTELREILRTLGVSDVRMEQGSLRCDVNTSLDAARVIGMGNPHRDQERQLAAQRRTGGALGDHPPGRAAGLRYPNQARDAALLRGDRRHASGAQQGRGDRLPVLPRARSGPDRARSDLGREAAHRPARTADRPAGPAPRCARGIGRRSEADVERRGGRSGGRDRRGRRAGRPRPATGGSATSRKRRTRARSNRSNCRSTRRRSPASSRSSPMARCRRRWLVRPSTACSRPAPTSIR